MKNIIFILILMAANFAHAENFQISGEMYNFSESKGFFHYGCEKNCTAITKVMELKKIDIKKLRSKEKFYGSVGSDVCRLVFKSKSIIGIASNKDQRAFCVFPDNSMIELNSLSKYLVDNHIVTE